MIKTKLYNLIERRFIADVSGNLNVKMDNCIIIELDSGMDIKATLRAYNDMLTAKDIIGKRLEEELNRRSALAAANNDGMPHGTETSDPVYKKVLLLLQQDAPIKKLECDKWRLENDILVIDIMLDQLTTEEKTIMEYYYIKGYNWSKIAGMVHYSRAECFRKRDSALQKMELLLK
jgi:DNA-directed RNA polymerase specialized sigma24 family protein